MVSPSIPGAVAPLVRSNLRFVVLHAGANSSERAVLEPSSPGPGGLPYVGGFQVEDDKTSGSIASSRQRIGPDTPQGSSLLEVRNFLR